MNQITIKDRRYWSFVLSRMRGDRFALASALVILCYGALALCSASGLFAIDFSTRIGPSYSPPNSQFWFGTDLLGRDVFARVVHGIEIAFSVGFITSIIAVPLGATLGASAGYFGGAIDRLVVWFYSTVTSVPQILLLISLTFVLGRGLSAIYVALGLTSWVGICRLVRAEVMKQKELDYVVAAQVLGADRARLIFRHILPNVIHLLIVDFSLRFIFAVKFEAVLSYLGLGVQGEPSWGILIADAKEELLRGIWWQMAAATCAMFGLVLALNVLGDFLRDMLDPRVNGA